MSYAKQHLGCAVKKAALGLAFSSLLSAAFAWSISGNVADEQGAPLAGVKISSFNYAGVSGTSDVAGNFSVSNEGTDGITDFGLSVSKMDVQYKGSVLNISNPSGEGFKVSLLDALGKLTYQREFSAGNSNVQLDLKKISNQKMMILRVAANGNSSNYVLTKDGARQALKKEGDLLATLFFALDGYDQTVYNMKAEVETDVKITMKKASEKPLSSSSVIAPPASSSSVTPPPSSSSKVEEVVSCDGKNYQAGDHRMTVNVNGKDRTYIMHVPASYKGDKAVPLVVDYHPIGGSGQGQLSGTTYKAQTDPEGVISLYPDGTSGKSPMGAGWNVGPCCSYDDDLEFSRNMINQVKEKVCIDNKRIYATGFSMGGGMSNHVACFMSDVYAAVAPAGMDLNTTNSATCNPERPISIIMFRGTNDFVCKYGGGDSGFNDGLNFLGAEGNFKFWAQKNGCSGTPTTNSKGCQEYSNCKDGTKVVLCTKQGGGHDQGDGSIGWPFLKQFTMP